MHIYNESGFHENGGWAVIHVPKGKGFSIEANMYDSEITYVTVNGVEFITYGTKFKVKCLLD